MKFILKFYKVNLATDREPYRWKLLNTLRLDIYM